MSSNLVHFSSAHQTWLWQDTCHSTKVIMGVFNLPLITIVWDKFCHPLMYERTDSEVEVTHSQWSNWRMIYDIHLSCYISLPSPHLGFTPRAWLQVVIFIIRRPLLCNDELHKWLGHWVGLALSRASWRVLGGRVKGKEQIWRWFRAVRKMEMKNDA